MEKANFDENATSEFFLRVKRNARGLVQPCLVAIYEEGTEPRVKLRQIGTGFRIQHRGRPVLITAKHVLFGKNGDENPGEKAIFVSGKLKFIGNLVSNEVASAKEFDLSVMYVDEFSLADCLPCNCLCQIDAKPRCVTIQGYLARDFGREAKVEALRPSPRIYTNSRQDAGDGYVGMRHSRRRNRDTESGMKVMAPIPEGLSGGPMLDSAKLLTHCAENAPEFFNVRIHELTNRRRNEARKSRTFSYTISYTFT